jgi:hypothetical protein
MVCGPAINVSEFMTQRPLVPAAGIQVTGIGDKQVKISIAEFDAIIDFGCKPAPQAL